MTLSIFLHTFQAYNTAHILLYAQYTPVMLNNINIIKYFHACHAVSTTPFFVTMCWLITHTEEIKKLGELLFLFQATRKNKSTKGGIGKTEESFSKEKST